MEIYQLVLIAIYLSINGFLTGNYYGQDQINPKDYSFFGIVVIIFLILFGLLFAIPMLIVLLIVQVVRKIWDFLNQKFQVKFFFNYYLTKEWDNMDRQQLFEINKITKNKFNGSSIHDRIYRYCTELVNKRNKYTYVETTDEETQF